MAKLNDIFVHGMIDDQYTGELRDLIIDYIRETRGVLIYNYVNKWHIMPNDGTLSGLALKITHSLHVAIEFALKLPVTGKYTAGEESE